MLILIDNYDSFTYNLYQQIAVHDKNITVIRNDALTLLEIDKLNPTGFILSPGPGRPENAGICVELIQHFGSTIPMLGVCLGHQAMAYTFGGKVIEANSIIHGKSDLIFHNRNVLFSNMSLPFMAGRYHSLIVDHNALPNCFDHIAEGKKGELMAIKHKEYPMYGIQFHPESILTPEGDQLINNFLAYCYQINKGDNYAA